MKQKPRDGGGGGGEKRDNQYSKKKNMQRLGGRGGLSLQAFANAKSKANHYNPALIKKQREFYRNAKYVSKYKRSLKQEQQTAPGVPTGQLEDGNETEEAAETTPKNKKSKKNNAKSLRELYEKKHEDEEKARIEREASIQAKKEERQRAEARRKLLKQKMFKKTKSGQPVMKYRIQHLLETIQRSNS